jgi:hypothetical protein
LIYASNFRFAALKTPNKPVPNNKKPDGSGVGEAVAGTISKKAPPPATNGL